MRIAKDFWREAIQLVGTKRPPIAFNIEEGVVDRKLGESRMYKLCPQPEEDNSPVCSLAIDIFELGSPKEWLIFKYRVKQVLREQNMGDMDTAYTLVQDLPRDNALTAFNNKQATLEIRLQTISNIV
eukprot:1143460-Ditylum_brightwellii.AAC.1